MIDDLTTPQLWVDGDVHATFARLRRDHPVSRQGDYWAVVRHADVSAVSKDPERFSSEPTASIRDLPPILAPLLESMLHMDDPRHACMRRVVSRAFSNRPDARTSALVDRVAAAAVDDACDTGISDGVETIAARVPLRVLCEMMGLPEPLWSVVSDLGETLTTARDAAAMVDATKAVHQLAAELTEQRRKSPAGDDLFSVLAHANVDGERLTPTQIGAFFLLLVTAGVQTSRHAISTGLVALAAHDDQRSRWLSDPGITPTAVEELVRFATPVRHMRRTATRDCMIGDTEVQAGDKVVLWYTSANRDEDVFVDADRLDLTRDPNPHLAFGVGPHYCLGAALARQEITAVFSHLLRRAPRWAVNDARPLTSSFMCGYEQVDCDFRPT